MLARSAAVFVDGHRSLLDGLGLILEPVGRIRIELILKALPDDAVEIIQPGNAILTEDFRHDER